MRNCLMILMLTLTTSAGFGQEKPALKEANILDKTLLDGGQGMYRVITQDGDVYFMYANNESLNKAGYARCGNEKPYVEFEIKKEKEVFNVYVTKGVRAPDSIYSVDLLDSIKVKDDIDVLFSTGKKVLNYSWEAPENPLEYVLQLDGKYSLYSQPDIWYDSIVFAWKSNELIVMKDGKYGLAKVTALKYKELKRLNQYLFVGKLFDDTKVYVDMEGREYFPSVVIADKL